MPVHRQPDSRLQDKEYAALLPVVNSALASLSAYATASGPPPQSIVAVVDAFAAADDALHHRYIHTVDIWRAQLVALNDLEDDLAAVLHDRDILVGTRLLKVSKSTRSSSTVSTPTSNTSTPAATAFAFPPIPTTNSQLAQAQAELQACEAHLVAKEREIDARRIAIAHDGLGARCRALIDYAAVWAEMGKQGLRALHALGQNQSHIHSQNNSQNDGSQPSRSFSTPAPDPSATPLAYYPLDNSFLTPSQTASHIVARSAEVSHESPFLHANPHVHAPKSISEREYQFESEAQLAREQRPYADTTLVIPVAPGPPIPQLTVPTGAPSRSLLSGGQLAPIAVHEPLMSETSSMSSPTPSFRKTSTRHSVETPKETSDRPSSAPHHPRHPYSIINTTADATKTVTNTISPALTPRSLSTFPTRDTSSSDEYNESVDEYGDPSNGHSDGRPPFQVVENDPIEVDPRSIFNTATDGSVPPNKPKALRTRTGSASASANIPDVPTSVGNPIIGSPLESVVGLSSVSGSELAWVPISGSTPTLAQLQPAEREPQTSLALLSSLRGFKLFRKPNKGEHHRQKRGRGAFTKLEDSDACGSPEPSGGVSTVSQVEVNWRRGAGGGRGGGWITRVEARRPDERRTDEDSNPKATATTSAADPATSRSSRMTLTMVDMRRRGSPPCLGGLGALAGLTSMLQGHGRECGNGSMSGISVHVSRTVRVDGWPTDDPVGVGAGSKAVEIAPGMGAVAATQTSTGVMDLGELHTTRRSMSRRPKTCVADLSGSDQDQSDEAMVGNGKEAEQPPVHEIETNVDLGMGAPPPRYTATTTTNTSHFDAATTRYRRSASFSEVDMHPAMSASSSPKPYAIRQSQVSDRHPRKQHKNERLIRVVAEVANQRPHSSQDWDQSGDRGGTTRSVDVSVPSVPSREVAVDRDRSPVQSGHLDAKRGQNRSEDALRMPLRSALRKARRTTSPGPVPAVSPVVQTTTMTTGKVVPRGGAAARLERVEGDERSPIRRNTNLDSNLVDGGGYHDRC